MDGSSGSFETIAFNTCITLKSAKVNKRVKLSETSIKRKDYLSYSS